MRIRRPLVLALAALCLIAAGCSEEESSPSEEGSSSLGESTTDSEASAPEAESAPPETSGALKEKPKIAKPTGPPPTKLVKEDLMDGKGSVAKAGDQLQVNYVGVSYKTGKEFDSSFKTGQPFQFELGAGMVIPGWDQGIEGMKVGGRRKLTIPSDLAYGPQGSPPAIGPDETLVFVVDLLGKE
jgi:peptidylprolyl isomerase